MASVKVEPVVKAGALIGEGPVWEESLQTLLFVDIAGRKIHRWSPTSSQLESVETGQPPPRSIVNVAVSSRQRLSGSNQEHPFSKRGRRSHCFRVSHVSVPAANPPGDTVGFAVPRRKGGYVAGVGRSILAVDWLTQTMTSLVEVDEDKPNNRLNDGKVDPVGRLLAGTMGREQRPAEVEKQQGSLFSVDSDLVVTKHLGQVDISNGLDWSLDKRTLFYIDSLSLAVHAFDYDINSGQLGNRREVYHMREGEGLPDGMTLDSDGRLWVACYNAGRVLNIDPATGVCLQSVCLPVTKTTSCCFGGPDYSELYVTSASLGLDQAEIRQQPLAGHTFRVRGLGVKGRPSNSFSG